MHLTKKDIENTERIKRLNIINSISGIKPGNLIGTSSKTGENLAIFNSIVHLGSNPPLLGFILRPKGEVPRNTYANIKETGYYTINHIHESFTEKAHYTSAKFSPNISEFEKCKLTPEYLPNFPAPFVKESKLKIGLQFVEEIPIKINNTNMIIGEVQQLIIPDESINELGLINLNELGTVGIGGLNSYYKLSHIANYPFARVKNIPDFS